MFFNKEVQATLKSIEREDVFTNTRPNKVDMGLKSEPGKMGIFAIVIMIGVVLMALFT